MNVKPEDPVSVQTQSLSGTHYVQRIMRIPDNSYTPQLGYTPAPFSVYKICDYTSRLLSVLVAKGGTFFLMDQRKVARWICFRVEKAFIINLYNRYDGKNNATATSGDNETLAVGSFLRDLSINSCLSFMHISHRRYSAHTRTYYLPTGTHGLIILSASLS
ncbi:uncharacterized protein GGS25DRAFT_510744 [Hypoxylon fragiforme]|uniref:uncharacterized protein n=1 Tax=Hypoxylon fragiforme TaxID=63214 RepID=UPI0020C651A6|nr:uncharacterized protein GGS25DRAFT_510744 [Hypoxylon fragiforme]KAI2603277.1 hypothetical protein GGS25DRAFT_510744 [Hypoxylon fragiforme]